MASCIRNISTENYQNLIIDFQVTVENVGDTFFETQCTNYSNQDKLSVSVLTFSVNVLIIHETVYHQMLTSYN